MQENLCGEKKTSTKYFKMDYLCGFNFLIIVRSFLLDGDADMLRHRSLVEDLHGFDHAPLGAFWQELGETFLTDEAIWEAMVLSIRKFLECGMLPEELAQ